MEVSASLHALATPPPRTPVPSNRRLGGPQKQSGSFEEKKNFLHWLGMKPPTFQPAAQSLYWLQYPGCHIRIINLIIKSIKSRFSIKKNVSMLQQLLPPNFADSVPCSCEQTWLMRWVKIQHHFKIFSCSSICQTWTRIIYIHTHITYIHSRQLGKVLTLKRKPHE